MRMIKSKKKLAKSLRRNWMLYLFMLPALLWLLIFHYGPIYGVQIAFQNYKVGDAFGSSEWVGLKYFIQFFKSYWFPIVMKNTVVISFLSFVLGFPLPIILALMLNEVRNNRYKKIVQTVTYAPYFISVVVLCGTIRLFLSPTVGVLGIAINAVREFMGMESVNLLMSGGAFKWIYVLSGIWQGTGWGSVVYFAALSAVDLEQIEAAKIDGATKLQRIWYINLPVLMPTIIIQLILRCGSLLNVGFEKAFLLQGENNALLSAAEVINTHVYRAGLNGAQFSYGSAVGLFNNVINAVLLIMVNWIVRKLDENMSLF